MGDSRVEVGIKVKVQLKCIDDVTERIRYDLYVCMHYKDPNSSKYINDTVKGPFALVNYDDSGIFLPIIDFINNVSVTHVEGFRFLISKSTNTVFIFRRYQLETEQILKIHEFPYDRQILSIPIRCYNAKLMNWFAEGDVPAGISSDAKWLRNNHVARYDGDEWHLEWLDNKLENEKTPSIFTCRIGVSRNAFYYLSNYVSITFMIVAAVPSVNVIDTADFSSRAGVTFTALLTIVAFKYAVMVGVPKKAYSTYLDNYLIIAIAFLIGVVLENYVVAKGNIDDYSATDNKFFLAFIVSWIGIHVILVVGSFKKWFYLSWNRIEKRDAEFEERVQFAFNRELEPISVAKIYTN